MITSYISGHVKYPLFLSDNTGASIVLKDFRKILKEQI